MATKVTHSTVTREVPSLTSDKEYIATMTPAGILIREKGRRTSYGPLSWDLIFLKAAQASVLGGSGGNNEDDKPKRRKRVSRSLLFK
jgi:hypothetical protein